MARWRYYNVEAVYLTGGYRITVRRTGIHAPSKEIALYAYITREGRPHWGTPDSITVEAQ